MYKKFLFINPFGVGDVLFTTPLIRAIKDNIPDSTIGYWCNERVVDLLRGHKRIDRVFALSRGDLKKIFQVSKLQGAKRFLSLSQDLMRERFEAALDFSLDHRYSLMAKFLGIRKRIGLNYKNRGRFLTERIDIEGYDGKHVVEYYLDLLKFLKIAPKDNRLDLTVSDKDLNKAQELLEEAGVKVKDLVIGIVPGAGASWGKDASYKHWPAQDFAHLADNLISSLKAKVLILGDLQERPIADIMTGRMSNKPLDLVGKTTLGELAGIIRRLKILITNDGGPLHIAAAEGINTVSIFGPVDDVVYGPYPPSQNHIVIKQGLDCQPCYRRFKLGVCKTNRQCLTSITQEQVFEAVRRLL